MLPTIHAYATLDECVSDAQLNVNDYWLHQAFPTDRPYSPPASVSLLKPGDLAPCGSPTPRGVSFYCPNNRTISLDPHDLAAANARSGRAGMYQALAHEWTHHVQFLVRAPYTAPNYELQADCGSGMFLHAAWPAMADSDLQALRRMLEATPSDSAHGTPAQRLSAFDDGYAHGASAHCGLPVA